MREASSTALLVEIFTHIGYIQVNLSRVNASVYNTKIICAKQRMLKVTNESREANGSFVNEGVSVLSVAAEAIGQDLLSPLNADKRPQVNASDRWMPRILVSTLLGLKQVKDNGRIDWLISPEQRKRGTVDGEHRSHDKFTESTSGRNGPSVFFRKRGVGQKLAQKKFAGRRPEEEAAIASMDKILAEARPKRLVLSFAVELMRNDTGFESYNHNGARGQRPALGP